MPDLQDPNTEPTGAGGTLDVAEQKRQAQAHLDAARRYAEAGDPGMAQREVDLAGKSLVGGVGALVDPQTGQIRDKTWWERNGDTVTFLIQAGLAVGGGIYLSGLGSAAQATPGLASNAGGVGLGETGAVAGIPGGAATVGTGATFAGGVGAEVTGSGLYGPGSAGFDAGAETQIDPGPAMPPGSDTSLSNFATDPPATTGLPNGASGLPGAQSAPSVGSDLIQGGSAVAGQTAGVAPAAAGPGIVSSQGIAGISYPSLIGAGLSYLQSRQSANAAQQASQAQIDAANRALDEQRRQYDLSRSDYLGNQAYTRQQISGLAPFQAIGVGSLSNLARLTGQPVPSGVANYQPPASQPPPAQAPVLQPNTLSGGQPNPSGTTSNVTSLADFVRTTSDARRSQLGLPPSGGAGGGLVTIQAPTGERQAVPASQAQFYTARGGRVVS